MTTIQRHPHSQAFHNVVDMLYGHCLNDQGHWGTQDIYDQWETVRTACLYKRYISFPTIAALKMTAIMAVTILSRLPEHTIGVRELFDLMKATHDRKQADYGRDEEPFENVLASVKLGIHPVLGICLRMNDKFTRIETFLEKGELQNESVDDSFLDISVYAVIAVVILEEELHT